MAKPEEKTVYIRKGTKFGPYTVTIGPLETGGTVDLSGGAFVRVYTSTSFRDSTVANGEIVVDDSAKTVAWTMLETDTVDLDVGTFRGRLVCVDGAGEDRVPLDLLCEVSEGI